VIVLASRQRFVSSLSLSSLNFIRDITPKGDSPTVPLVGQAFEAIQILHQSFRSTEVRLKKVEEASKFFGETQRKMDDKLDGIYNLLIQWNTGGEPSGIPKPHRSLSTSSPPPP
jgi:hypothetical protein